MAKLLYKLGNWSVKHSKKVILGTVGILIVLAIVVMSIGSSFSEDMSIPGTESEQALKIVQKNFSGSSNGQIQLVFKAPKNKTLESKEVTEKITKTLNEIKKDDKAVKSAVPPIALKNLSKDKKIGYAIVSYDTPGEKVSEASKDKIKKNVKKLRNEGIQTEFAGDVQVTPLEIGGVSEVVGVIVAFIVLVITFTSFLVAGMPILIAAIGLGISLILVMIGTHLFDITSFSMTLGAMLGLAVGIDYSLFIVSRFRKQLKEGHSVKESVAIANGTAGSAVIFAGITVIVALLGLSVAQITFLSVMGIAAALCVLVAILTAVIVVPAILGLMGHKLGPSRRNKFLQKITRSGKKQEGSNKWGKFVTKRPILVTFLGIVILAFIAIPASHLELGLPDNGTKSKDTTERQAYDLQTKAYGEGVHSTLVLAVQTSDKTKDVQGALKDTVEDVSHLPDVKSVSPPIPSKSGKLYLINVTPKTGPNDTETKDLVNDIRDKAKDLKHDSNLDLRVTGTTAVNIDLSQKLLDAFPLFASLIVAFAFILLMVVFRSILVPLKAVLGFLLSLGATLGFVVFVVQDGHFLKVFDVPTASPVLCFLPVIIVGILFGLAMDYEVFLVSRMREVYSHTKNAREAILAGMRDSGGVVTAAGLIMVSVFAGFMLAPDPMIKQMGIALTFGVLFDAFVVRLAIVPAVMTLLGNSAWYLPKWLDKILPNIDIEGESIFKDKEVKEVKEGKGNK